MNLTMPRHHHPRTDSIILFLGSLILFTWGLRAQEITGFDSRFYLFAQEMWRHGVSWFPMTYHQAYPDYPATSTLFINAFAHLTGQLNKFIAVLPTAIMASLTLVFTYLIGQLQQRRWGWCAVFLLLLTLTFFKSARAISLDMYTAFFTTASFYLVYSADLSNHLKRRSWIYGLFVLGFIFRGPIGLVIPTGVVCVYELMNRQYKRFFITGMIAFLLLCLCTAILLALAQHVGGDAFLQDVLRMEVIGRIDNPYLPFYFYFTDSFGSDALAYPLMWLVIPGVIYYAISTRTLTAEMKLLLLLFGWVLVILLGMSIPDDKKVRYILPMLPAAALIAAYPFVAGNPQRYFVWLRKGLTFIFLFFPMIFLILILFIQTKLIQQGIAIDLNLKLLISVLVLLQITSLIWMRNVLLFAALSFVCTYLAVIEPVQIYFDQSRDFVVRMEIERLAAHAALVFYRESPDGTPIKYIVNMTSDELPVFIETETQLQQYQGNAFFVTSQAYFEELPKPISNQFQVIAVNKLGHIPIIVFRRK